MVTPTAKPGRRFGHNRHMPWFELVSIVLLAALAWLWYDSVQVREIAVRAARQACSASGFQFLDETVAIAKLRFARDEDGRLLLQRTYFFEYSDTGDNRRPGSVEMLGPRITAMNIGLHLVVDADRPLS
jgi:hypothetical protein